MKLPIHLPEPHSLNSPRFYALGLAFDGYMLLLAWLAQREGSRPWKLAIMPVGLWCLWELSGGVAWPGELKGTEEGFRGSGLTSLDADGGADFLVFAPLAALRSCHAVVQLSMGLV